MIEHSSLAGLAGKHVTGQDGHRIGTVTDVYESTDGGSGTFATVATGLFGSGASFFPLQDAELRDGEVVVPYTKDVVKHAPRVDNDEELSAPEEQRLFDYYSTGGHAPATTAHTDGTNETVGRDTSGPTTDDAMTRSEERLQVGTERVEAGRARLRKHIATETETRTVPLAHDEVRIEREPVTEANAGKAYDGPALSEEEHEVVLTAERAVTSKETVPVERVRLDTQTVTGQAHVTEEVRKEQIDVTGMDTGTRDGAPGSSR